MQLFEKKSFTRKTGFACIITYCLCALWAVGHGQPMPDLPPVLAGFVSLIYGINTAKAVLPGKDAPKA